jgi:hypothetical protein
MLMSNEMWSVIDRQYTSSFTLLYRIRCMVVYIRKTPTSKLETISDNCSQFGVWRELSPIGRLAMSLSVYTNWRQIIVNYLALLTI